MDKLISESLQRVNSVSVKFKRYLYGRINWENRLIAIKGSRGVGKTTLLLQYIKSELPKDQTVLYVPLDHTYFYDNSLINLADDFVRNGGKHLFLDEIHKYSNWSRELKLIYDKHIKLKIIFTSSSILEIYKGESDLSRRAVSYVLNELSLREYIELEKGIKLPVIAFDDLLTNHIGFALEIMENITPLFEFRKYLKLGAYPFFVEGLEEYPQRLLAALNQVLENDLIAVHKLDFSMVLKIKKLLFAISSSAPFKPNISKLSERVSVTRPTLMRFLDYLERAQLIYELRSSNVGISLMAKPEKIYIHNTNLIFLLLSENTNIGTLRETFFLNQLSVGHSINYSKASDFFVDNTYTFEIGGKNKKQKQISGIKNSYVVKDNIELGAMNVLPLWLFGFLY